MSCWYSSVTAGAIVDLGSDAWCAKIPITTPNVGSTSNFLITCTPYGYVENMLVDGDSVSCVIVFLWGGVQSNLGMYTEIYCDMWNRINEMCLQLIYMTYSPICIWMTSQWLLVCKFWLLIRVVLVVMLIELIFDLSATLGYCQRGGIQSMDPTPLDYWNCMSWGWFWVWK